MATGAEHPAPRANGTAGGFRVIGGRTARLADGALVWCRVSLPIGSGVPAAGPLIIPLRIGKARPVAGVIHNRLVLSPSGSGFTPPNEISYRGVKLPKVCAAFGSLLAAVRGRLAAGGHPAQPRRT